MIGSRGMRSVQYIRRFTSRVRVVACVALCWVHAACEGDGRGLARSVPPTAEFLVAAGDSTWWIRSSAEGIRVRSAPILLTKSAGRLFEVFVAEEFDDYVEASLASSRLFARDIMRTDSVTLFDDPSVRNEIARWKRRHPDAQPLTEEDEEDSDPPTSMLEEVSVIDVHGPWVSFAQSVDVDIEGQVAHRHERRKRVVNVHTGERASLATLFGLQEAATLVNAGRNAFTLLRDSIARINDDRATRAKATLTSFRFDQDNFALSEQERKPAVNFLVPGSDIDGSALVLNIDPIIASAPSWWSEVLSTLPKWNGDSSALLWTRPKYVVTAATNAERSELAITLAAAASGHATRRQWQIATVPTPIYQLIALDDVPVSRELRDALSRAFDVSATLDGIGQRAGWHGARPRASARLRLAHARIAHSRPASRRQ